jgi:capsular exopolysaccharide synthesis family protein
MADPASPGPAAPSGVPPEPVFLEEREAQLRDYLAVLRKHRWVILAVVAVAMGATALVTYRQVPLYRASATVNIRREPPAGADLETAWSYWTTQREFMETQFKLIASRTVARRALQSLGRVGTEGYPDEPRTYDAFLKTVVVEPIKDTFLVRVSVISADATQAAVDANSVVEAYVAENRERQKSTAQDKLDLINNEMPKVQGRLDAAQQALKAFKAENKVQSYEDYRFLITNKLQKLHAQMIDVASERRSADARYRQVQKEQEEGGDLNRLPWVSTDRVLDTLKTQRVQLLQERLDLLARYKARHPLVQAVQEKLNVVEDAIRIELAAVASRIQTELEEARFRERDLDGVIQAHNAQLDELEKKATEYEALRSDIARAEKDLSSFIDQRNAIESGKEVNLNNVWVVDSATPPEFPFKPDPMLNLMLAAVVGLVGGIGLAFLLEHLDDTLASPDEVERALGLPVVASIPHVGDQHGHLVVTGTEHDAAAEAFRALRTALVFSQSARTATHLLVTSATAGEGKTFTAVNLAAVLAQGGARTVVVDADLRRPALHVAFGIAQGPGLCEVLRGETTAAAVAQPTPIPNLHVITAGKRPEQPSELLGGASMPALLAELGRTYDRVIIDTPPVLVVTDPCVVAALAHAVLPVVSASQVARSQARDMVDALLHVGARPIGVVLNQVSASSRAYGYYAYARSRYARSEG